MIGEHRSHIIIIDDSSTMRTLLADMLNQYDIQTLAAESMELAFLDLERKHFDVAIVDIFMPGMGGIEGIKKIRELGDDVKIIAISAGHAGMDKDQALKAATIQGADAALAKPFEEDDLMAVVNDLMGEKETAAEVMDS